MTDQANVFVQSISHTPYRNCSDFLSSSTPGTTTYQQGSCFNTSTNRLSYRYACGTFGTTLAMLRTWDSNLPSPTMVAAAPTTSSPPPPSAPPTPAPTFGSLMRTTSYGPVVGQHVSTNVCGWYGVRFAAPAVGPLRWRPPQPPQSWTTPLNATEHQSCLQYASTGRVGSEAGCLTVDVWAPATAVPGESALPVLFWIHGGGFTDFAPSFPSEMATSLVEASVQAGTPVIAVSVNYRMGGLGFMGLPELAAENGTHGSSGNYGILDQIAALQWVRDNAAHFGGSATQVTIYGESAGAYSVCTHLSSPLSQGLFSAAILQSA